MRSWLYLAGAIGAEVIGTSSIKILSDLACPRLASLLFLYVMIGLSYFLLSLAVRRVALGLAFATWEGVGIALVTLVSFFLGEEITPMRILGIGLMIIGILLIKIGMQKNSEKTSSHSDMEPHHV